MEPSRAATSTVGQHAPSSAYHPARGHLKHPELPGEAKITSQMDTKEHRLDSFPGDVSHTWPRNLGPNRELIRSDVLDSYHKGSKIWLKL